MKKSIKILVTIMLLITVSTSLSASSLIRDISGKENKGITVTYNGKAQTLKDGHGNVIYPVIIDGSSYLPVKAITEMVGCEIAWDGPTKTIAITKKDNSDNQDGAVPTDLEPVNNNNGSNTNNPPTQNTPPATTSGNTGSLTDPIALGTMFAFDDPYGYDDVRTNAHYEVTVTKAETFSNDQIEALGFVIEDDPHIEYMMLTIELNVSNATYSGPKYTFLKQFKPEIWGSITPIESSIIGGRDFGFDGSLDNDVENKVDYKQVNPGETHSFKAKGKVLLPVYKNMENYLVIQRSEWDDYDKSFIYFKLK